MSVNTACIGARHFDSNFNEWKRQGAAPSLGRDQARSLLLQLESFSEK
jgi:hypothetical protein